MIDRWYLAQKKRVLKRILILKTPAKLTEKTLRLIPAVLKGNYPLGDWFISAETYTKDGPRHQNANSLIHSEKSLHTEKYDMIICYAPSYDDHMLCTFSPATKLEDSHNWIRSHSFDFLGKDLLSSKEKHNEYIISAFSCVDKLTRY